MWGITAPRCGRSRSGPGISHVGLLYYFPNREALLAAVLERRDEEDTARIAAKVFSPRGAVQHLVDLADHNARHPGMVELYVRLAAEAVAATTVLTFLGTTPAQGWRECCSGEIADADRPWTARLTAPGGEALLLKGAVTLILDSRTRWPAEVTHTQLSSGPHSANWTEIKGTGPATTHPDAIPGSHTERSDDSDGPRRGID